MWQNDWLFCISRCSTVFGSRRDGNTRTLALTISIIRFHSPPDFTLSFTSMCHFDPRYFKLCQTMSYTYVSVLVIL